MKLINGGKQSKKLNFERKQKKKKGLVSPNSEQRIWDTSMWRNRSSSVEKSQSKYGNRVFLTGCDRYRKREKLIS